jgi:hypothetical protein
VLVLQVLTPKGLNVHGVTKPVLVSVVSPHTISRFFETFCEDASHNYLRVSANFMILGARFKSYGCLKFLGRVWPGRACVVANQQELTTSTKSGE